MHVSIEQPLLVYQSPIVVVELCSVMRSGVRGVMKLVVVDVEVQVYRGVMKLVVVDFEV